MKKRQLIVDNQKLKKHIDELHDVMVKQNAKIADLESQGRQEILKNYDYAILIKRGKTFLLEKGVEEKKISYFKLEQAEDECPQIIIEKKLV